VRDYAAQKGLDEEAALQAGMQEKAEEFKKSGSNIYVEASSSIESSPVEFKAAGKE
jgi:hypothetical protein